MAAATTNGASSSSSPPGFNPGQSPNYSFVPPPTPSPYLRAFFAYVDAMHAWDFDRVMQCFDESLEHRILPKSLGRPVLNKRQYGEYFKGTMPLFVKFRVSASSSVYRNVELIIRTAGFLPWTIFFFLATPTACGLTYLRSLLIPAATFQSRQSRSRYGIPPLHSTS